MQIRSRVAVFGAFYLLVGCNGGETVTSATDTDTTTTGTTAVDTTTSTEPTTGTPTTSTTEGTGTGDTITTSTSTTEALTSTTGTDTDTTTGTTTTGTDTDTTTGTSTTGTDTDTTTGTSTTGTDTDTSTTGTDTDTSTTGTGTDTGTSTTDADPLCGNGVVEGGEECDDGDPDNTDECTTKCAPPSCADDLVSGAETDVDCGGDQCGGCEIAEACLVPTDCKSGSCDQNVCVVSASCKAIKAAQPNAADGLYTIDPDGGGAIQPFDVWCDMTTDGGGWALAIRFAPSNGIFDFYSPHWTSISVVNEALNKPTDTVDGKFQAYNVLPGAEIRGCLQHPQSKVFGCKFYPLPATQTLLDLFTNTPIGSDISMKGLYFTEDQVEMVKWLTIQGRSLADASIAPNYFAVGINIDDDQSCYDARIRFGLVLNNEPNISSLNDAAGFGAQSHYTVGCDQAPGVDNPLPWRTPAGMAAGPTPYNTAGHIWIR